MATPAPETFAHLLETAINEPGLISSAYSAFHNYSLGNQLLALSQCMGRGITPGPIATYQRWKELGRYVRKGEKAITLCRPVTVKKATAADDSDEQTVATFFVYKPLWFVLAQTEGQPMAESQAADWNAATALHTLNVTETPFDAMNGNVMGFARGRSIAVNPVNPMPHKTRFHELAHVLLGHTGDGIMNDEEMMPRNLRECEAESVALLCCAALNLPGVEFSRGYIQSWWDAGNPIPERSAQRILKAANQILVAGRPTNCRRGGAVVMRPDARELRAALAEVANALQGAVGLAALVQRNADRVINDVVQLEAAVGRAADALRRVQPQCGGRRADR